MQTVFVVQHLNILPQGEDSVKFIGVYRTEQAARAAVGRLARQPGFCKHPNIVDPLQSSERRGFYIDEYELDEDHWTEGFVTMVGNKEYEE